MEGLSPPLGSIPGLLHMRAASPSSELLELVPVLWH